MNSAFEVIGRVDSESPFVITCEHASNRVPPPLEAAAGDQPFLESHWGWDIGAADVTRALVDIHDAVGVLSCFSRLVVDPNRHRHQHGLILEEVDGTPITFNQDLPAGEIDRRMDSLHETFHRAIGRVIGQKLENGGPVVFVSVHSFTPKLRDDVRKMELGVLFDLYEEEARILAEIGTSEGFVTALNQPYSGRDALMYSAHRHGTEHGVTHIELEIRQDLIGTSDGAREVGERLARTLERWLGRVIPAEAQ
jgi:predicted N-formylglutamate amidohydrolase